MYLSINKVAKQLNKSAQTLRNWEKTGELVPAYKTKSGYRYYTEEQINKLLGIEEKERVTIGYCRVSSRKQQDDLERQTENMRNYLCAKGYKFEIITDIGSGINYNKVGLNILLDKVIKGEVDKVVVLHKDRLLRFGFELVENLCKRYGTSIEVVDNTPKTEEQELVEDLVQIITVFSCKLQGKRANKMKKVIAELRDEDI